LVTDTKSCQTFPIRKKTRWAYVVKKELQISWVVDVEYLVPKMKDKCTSRTSKEVMRYSDHFIPQPEIQRLSTNCGKKRKKPTFPENGVADKKKSSHGTI